MSRGHRGDRDGPRWTRVPVTVWDQLNGQTVDAKLVYQVLLTGRHRTAAPGLFRSGPGALAEVAEFRTKRFLRAVDELQKAGLVLVDLDAKVWFLPLAVEDDPAANPNVTAAWRKVIAELPDCQVTREAAARLLTFSKESGSEVEPLQHATSNRSGNGSGNGSANQIPLPIPNQIPEQKQIPALEAPTVDVLMDGVMGEEQITHADAEEFLAFYEKEDWRDVGGAPLASWKTPWTLWKARKRTLKRGTGRQGPWKPIQPGEMGR